MRFNLLNVFGVISCAVNQKPSLPQTNPSPSSTSHLGPAHTDDAVHVAVGVVEEGHGDGMLAGRDPVPLGARVDLEHMGPGAEERLLPEDTSGETETNARRMRPK